uniref:Uncharacterized protein n=1 Tax=Fagus sylvatica TaxID=28930 RepID=A0A2N9HF25_FAGSY
MVCKTITGVFTSKSLLGFGFAGDGSVRAARRGGTRGCGFAGFSGLLGGAARWDSWLRAARRGGTRGCGFAGFSGLLGCGFAGFAGDGSVSSWLRVARWDSGWVWGGSGGGFGWLAGSGGAGV